MSYNPNFEINNEIINLVAEIAELTGRVSSEAHLDKNPKLRRANRIKTIHDSLAIEQNTLSLEQVTDVLNGKTIIAPPKDIEEVKNAYEIYELLDTLNPYSIDDLLKAHSVLMRGLVDGAGQFRSKPVGVFDSKTGEVVHIGTLPAYVPQLTQKLIYWTKNNDAHTLIKSCVFHYEFEVIHPFLDGNGRLGRLWHTLVLSKYNPIFAYLPIESMIYKNQQEYYSTFNQCDYSGNSTEFILFMLKVIKSTLVEVTCSNKKDAEQVEEQVKMNMLLDYCKEPRTRAQMQEHIGVLGRKMFNNHYLLPLLNSGKLVMTIPDKPNSRNQKYVLADLTK